MRTTGLVFSPVYYQHDSGEGHPESTKRLRVIIRQLRKSKLQGVGNWQFIEPEKARLRDVKLVHDTEYIEFVENLCRSGGGLLDVEGYTVASPESFEVALYAAGGTLKAVNLVMEGKFKSAFALVRPPGHHAGRHCARGFCIFNNTAIAAEHLLREFKMKRILILDIDAHHGNGTQEIFYDTDKVLCISLHEDPREFPRKGFTYEVGKGEGLGYTVNIPLPFRTGDRVYLKATNEIVRPIIQQYKPQFVLISAGLDGHYTDPVASLSLSALCYQKVYEVIVNLALEICGGKLVSVLEGGYSLKFVGKIAVATVAEMSGAFYSVKDRSPVIAKRVEEKGEKVIREVKQVQKGFWSM